MNENMTLEVVDVEVGYKSIDISWDGDSGFGHLIVNFDKSKDGESVFCIETETMGEEFAKQILELAKDFIISKMMIVE